MESLTYTSPSSKEGLNFYWSLSGYRISSGLIKSLSSSFFPARPGKLHHDCWYPLGFIDCQRHMSEPVWTSTKHAGLNLLKRLILTFDWPFFGTRRQVVKRRPHQADLLPIVPFWLSSAQSISMGRHRRKKERERDDSMPKQLPKWKPRATELLCFNGDD